MRWIFDASRQNDDTAKGIGHTIAEAGNPKRRSPMRQVTLSRLTLLIVILSLIGAGDRLSAEPDSTTNPRVLLDTDRGEIVLELFADRAPLTTAYFLGLVEAGSYDGVSFYRSTTLENEAGHRLVQGGPLHETLTGKQPKIAAFITTSMLETVESTSMTGLTHTEGIVSMARDLSRTGHVLPDLFICLGEFPELDEGGRTEPDEQGFPAFGRVVSGLEIINRLSREETAGDTWVARLNGQILTNPLIIQSASVDSESQSEKSSD